VKITLGVSLLRIKAPRHQPERNQRIWF